MPSALRAFPDALHQSGCSPRGIPADIADHRNGLRTASVAVAQEYGLVDKVLDSRKLNKPATNTATSHD